MDRNFSDWYSKVDMTATGEKVKLRADGVDTLASELKPESFSDLVKTFFWIDSKDQSFIDSIVDFFQKIDASFKTQDNRQEVQVLAGAVIAAYLSENKNPLLAAKLALLVICCYAKATGPKPAIQEVILRCENVLIEYSASLRASSNFKIAKAPALPTKAEVDAIKSQIASNQVGPLSEGLHKIVDSIVSAARHDSGIIRSAHLAFSLQQDEIDLLWWIVGEFSNELDKAWTKVGYPSSCLVIAKETVDHVSVMPGPMSIRAILARAISCTSDDYSASLTIAEAVNKSPKEWREKLAQKAGGENQCDLFPIHNALYASITSGSGWVSAHERKTKTWNLKKSMSCIDLMQQAYQEALAIKFSS